MGRPRPYELPGNKALRSNGVSMDSSTEWWRPSQRKQLQVRAESPEAQETRRFDLSYWALIGFTVILLLAPQEQFAALAPLRIALLTAVIAVIACGFKRLSRGMPLIEPSPDVLLLLLFTFWAVVTLPFSAWPGGSAGVLTGPFLKAIICCLLLSHAVTDFRQLRGIAWCLVLCAVPLALTTLANYAAGASMGGGSERVIGYTSGLTQNPNDMALMLNLILPLSIALLLGARSQVQKLLLGAIAMLIVVAVIVTFSRAGFLTLVFIGACFAWLLRNRRQRIWIPVILMMGIFALPLLPSSYYERIGTIINIEEDQTNSAQERLEDIKIAAGEVLSKPLVGSGIGMSVLAMNEARGDTWTDVHNVYLQLALDLGFTGLVLYLLLLYQCLRVTGNIMTGRGGPPASQPMVYMAEALRVSMLAFALSAMFYPIAYNFYFFYFAGMAIAAGRIVRQQAQARAQPDPKPDPQS